MSKTVREIASPGEGGLSNELKEEFLRFLEYHPARRVSRNLTKMLLEYLMHETAGEADYFKTLIYDLEGLFDLLDVAEETYATG